MSDWQYEVVIGPAFDPGDFPEHVEQAFRIHRDRTVKILRTSFWLRDTQASWYLTDLINELAGAEDIRTYDTVMDGIYALADEDLCWIITQERS